ncbi:hypothetical protein [Streptomyces sp. NPDC059256]|uniref:hypothetical protein n=1 Tax=Streptomyces sp. NPDC059256 TaxID=3346794 RepID=UPI0036A6ACDD
MRHRILITAVAVIIAATACTAPSEDARVQPSVLVTQGAPAPSQTPSLVVPDSSKPTPSVPTAPKLTPVTIDGWRYGYAWRGFFTDVKGFGGQYDKPGEVHVNLTVQMTVTDDRRPKIPSPNSLWVGQNYGFNFFVRPPKLPGCMPLEEVGLCELTSGPFYSGCEEQRDDGDGTSFAPRGEIVMSCRIDASFPESVKPSDFKVGVRVEECCETDVAYRVWLPFQDLPQPPPVTESERGRPSPGARYL